MNTTKKLKIAYLLFISLFLMNTGELTAQKYVSPLTPKTKINIIECTRGERMAVGSDGNVLRWSNTNGKEQEWQVISKGSKYYLQNFKQAQMLEVAWNGNVYATHWNPSKTEQLFGIEKMTLAQAKAAIPAAIYNKYAPIVECTKKKGLTSPVEFVRIRESTKNEYVSVGSNGNILRWARTGDKTQVFILVTQGADLRCEDPPLTIKKFRMVECTKGEMVAAGSNDNVLRWYPTNYYEQEWQLKPEKEGSATYYIESMKTKFSNIKKNLAVNPSSGNISIETHKTGDRNQLFRFEILSDAKAKRLIPYNIYDKYADLKRATEANNPDAVQYVRIIESSRDERVAVGSNGNVLRWEKKEDNSQVFILVETTVLNSYQETKFDSFSGINFIKFGAKWAWNGPKGPNGTGVKRTIRSPYDGEPIMTYTTNYFDNCDGCSVPLSDPTTVEYKKILLKSCLAHDADYQAPWEAAGFEFGRQVSDDLFLINMRNQVYKTFKNSPFELTYGSFVPEIWYKFVSTLGESKYGANRSIFNNGAKIIEKGGIVSITNTTQASVSATVSYVSQSNKSIKIDKDCGGLNILDATIITNYDGWPKLVDGTPVSEIGKSGVDAVLKSNVYVTTIPVTVKATRVKVEIKVDGQVKFTRSYTTPPTENLVVRNLNGRYTVEIIPSSKDDKSSINVEGKFRLSTNSSYTTTIVKQANGVRVTNSDGQSVYYVRVGKTDKYVCEARSHQSIEYITADKIRYFDTNKKTEAYFIRIK